MMPPIMTIGCVRMTSTTTSSWTLSLARLLGGPRFRPGQRWLAEAVLRRAPLVLAAKCGGDEEPDQGERDVERRERSQHESQSRSEIDDASLQHITEAHKESVNRRFRLVLCLPARRKEERLPGRILDRIVGAIVENLECPHQAEQGSNQHY